MEDGRWEMNELPLVNKKAIDVARECYDKWGLNDFDMELAAYLEDGMVIVRPDLLMLAKIIDIGDGPAWYIRMAVGNLKSILLALPVFLPKICFTRHGEHRMRFYSLKRIARYIMAKEN
jgi:hypothetical protein